MICYTATGNWNRFWYDNKIENTGSNDFKSGWQAEFRRYTRTICESLMILEEVIEWLGLTAKRGKCYWELSYSGKRLNNAVICGNMENKKNTKINERPI